MKTKHSVWIKIATLRDRLEKKRLELKKEYEAKEKRIKIKKGRAYIYAVHANNIE